MALSLFHCLNPHYPDLGGVHPPVEQGYQRIVLEVPAQTVEQRLVLAQLLAYEIEFALQGKLASITEDLGHGRR